MIVSTPGIIASSISSAFNPIIIPDLKLWLKSSIGVTLNVLTVSKWADQSGFGNDFIQNSVTKQPLFVSNFVNGKPALKFDGINDDLGILVAIQASATEITTFIVIRLEGGGNYGIVTGNAGGWQYLQDGAGYRVGEATISAPMTTGAWYLRNYTVTKVPSPVEQFFSNGSLLSTQTQGEGTGYQQVKYIGSNNGSTERFLDGYICEILFYDRVLSSPEISNITTYLNAEYAIF